MPSIDYRALRSSVTIEQVLDLLEFISSAREGDQVRGLCLSIDKKPHKDNR